ncbi:MAG: c-type cytochrome [Octadecabacter sp.]
MRNLISTILVGLGLATPLIAQDVDNGSALYQRHCATCHGLDASGNGPMAPALVIQPPDLTALAADNGGVFPTFRAVMRIDGRDPLVSHGSPMPVYGAFFQGDDTALKAASGQPIMTSRLTADLIAFLEGVQD